MWASLIPLFTNVASTVTKSLFPAPEDEAKRAEMEAKLQTELLSAMGKQGETLASLVDSEANSQSWLTRNWRPVTMLTFLGIIVNNFVLVPYAGALGAPIVPVEIPTFLEQIMLAMFGIYAAGRSVEQSVKAWVKK